MPSTTVEIKGKDRSKRAFSSVSRSLKLMKGAVGTLNGAVVGLVSGAVMGAMIKNLAETADRLGKTSSRLGIASEDLQKFRFAAEQSGMEVSAFDMSLQRFTRRVAEAAEGTGVAKDALEQMGIEIKDSEGNLKSSSTLLKEVADAFARTTSQSERVKLAFKLFDSEGVKMVNMLQQGSGAIDAMGNQLDSVGGIITDKTIKASESLNDRLNILKTSAEALLTPLVELANSALDPFFEKTERMAMPLEKQEALIQGQINALVAERSAVKDVVHTLEFMGQTIRFVIQERDHEVKIIQKQIDNLAVIRAGLQDEIAKRNAVTEATRKQAEAVKKKAQVEKDALNDSLIVQDNYNAKLAYQYQLYGQGMAMMDQSAKKLKKSNDKKLQDESDYLDQRIIANMERSRTHRAMLEQEAEFEKQLTKDVAMSSLATIQSLSAGVANESRDLFELNKAVSIASVYINAAEASSKALAQLGAFGIPVAGVIYALAIANIAKIGSQEFPGREYGGDVVANKSYIVGEAGPELFTPGRTGGITPNNKLRGTTNVNFQINTVDASSFDVLLNSRRGMIVNMINQAMNRQGRVGLT
jgi:hypothetical protein